MFAAAKAREELESEFNARFDYPREAFGSTMPLYWDDERYPDDNEMLQDGWVLDGAGCWTRVGAACSVDGRPMPPCDIVLGRRPDES